MGAVLMSVALMLLFMLVLVTSVDYGLYSMNCRVLGRGMDFAASAAVQEIDRARSREGISAGYDEETGLFSVNDIYIDADSANRVFFTVLSQNTGFSEEELRKHMLTVIVTPSHTGMECRFYREGYSETVLVERPEMLEAAINQRVRTLYPQTGPDADKRIIFVNGNIKTNQFKERPYFFAFVRGLEINGLLRNRKVYFACFAGAKIDRRESS